ncbi:hypothetical protein [Teredinibacter turnerae]|uniref:hypothetical protein n=1 Tax=Teredinibacter turnerae TaxID=2426 RepID=UPI0030CB53AD
MDQRTSEGAANSNTAGYSLMLTGEIREGFEPDQVRQWLAQALKIPLANASALLAGRSRCIRRNLTEQDATRYLKLFQSKGVGVRLSLSPVSAMTARGQTVPLSSDTQVVDTRFFQGDITAKPAWHFQILAAVLSGTVTTVICGVYLLLMLACFAGGLHFIVNAALSLDDAPTAYVFVLHLISGLFLLSLFGLLLRPVFAQQNPQRISLEVDPAKQARLVQFVNDTFAQVGAPAPDKILVNYDTEVTAEFSCPPFRPKQGSVSVTLGMPLIANIRTPQLAAFIAHEASMMRPPMLAWLFGVVKRVRHRFDDCAENQDLWSRRLDAWDLDQASAVKGVFVSALAILNHYSALVFKPFSIALNSAGAMANRYLVNAADFYAAHLVGSKAIVESFRELSITHHALHQAEERMFGQVGERQLVNNLPALVHHFAAGLSPRDLREIEDAMNRADTKRDYDYPSDRSRIIFAEDLDASGQCCVDYPAAELFTNIGVLNEQVTLLYYGNLQIPFAPLDLVDVHRLASLADKDMKREQLSTQYFNNWFDPDIFWKIPAPTAVQNLNAKQRRHWLNELVAEIRHTTPDYLQLVASEQKLLTTLVNYAFVSQVRKAGYKLTAADTGLSEAQLKTLDETYAQHRAEYNHFQSRLGRFREVMGTRLFLAVSLHPDAAKRKVGVMLLQMLATLNQHSERLTSLQVRVAYLPKLAVRERDKKEDAHGKRIQRIMADVARYGAGALNSLTQFKCTFNNAHENLAQFVAAHMKQSATLDAPKPLETVAYFTEINHGLAESNRMINHQIAMIAMESELLNKITPVRLATA